MNDKIQAIRGMNDILPDEAHWWDHFEETTGNWLDAYGYRTIRLPIVEQTALFRRSIGEVTDIVEKEMYTFVDHLNGESLTLRPEGTAACVRAVLQHNLLYPGPLRLAYMGPMFRHERPQKGRYRQFHQVGVEALGFEGPDIDAEQIAMAARLWKKLGLSDVRLEINSLGDAASRAGHRGKLIRHFEQHMALLDEDAKRRLHSNPLRILDSKNPSMREIVENAPKLIDDLDEDSAAHFARLKGILDELGISYEINPRLVRGLDYYNRTVFEWVTDRLGAQGTVCAGGRYDGLVSQIGGKPTPACGFAIGIERILALIQEDNQGISPKRTDIYVVHQGEAASQFAVIAAEFFRDSGFSVILHCGGGSFKSQMKKADASGARFAGIIGDEEAHARQMTVKPLREELGQFRMHPEEAVAWLRSQSI
ncbi:MAG TPA: histidine--tRNA ligase [Burkholderiales bacterium]|nr:histidine--tRNA ligase [Burkholderiales bacterium]